MFLRRNAAKYLCLKSLKNVTLQTRDGNIFLACGHLECYSVLSKRFFLAQITWVLKTCQIEKGPKKPANFCHHIGVIEVRKSFLVICVSPK